MAALIARSKLVIRHEEDIGTSLGKPLTLHDNPHDAHLENEISEAVSPAAGVPPRHLTARNLPAVRPSGLPHFVLKTELKRKPGSV